MGVGLIRDCVKTEKFNKVVDELRASERARLEDNKLFLVAKNLTPRAFERAAELIDEYGFIAAVRISREQGKDTKEKDFFYE